MYKDRIVGVPKGVRIKKQNSNKYVYLVIESTYHKDKQYNTDKRICIGKLVNETQMHPNENYYLHFVDEEAVATEAPVFSDTLHIGGYMVVQNLFEESTLMTLLEAIFPEHYAFMMDIIYYFIFENTDVMQHMGPFLRTHYTFDGEIHSDSFCSKFFRYSVKQDCVELLMDGWNQFNAVGKDLLIGYDSTNFNCSSQESNFAEFGHAKVDEGLPQINLSYAVNQKTGKPLFYELYPGSINDQSECKFMVERASRYGYEGVTFILDRGYFSKENLNFFDINTYNFIIMAKTNTEGISQIMQEVMHKIRAKSKYYIAEHHVYGVSVKREIYKGCKERYVHVYYDDIQASEEREAINSYLDLSKKAIEKEMKSTDMLRDEGLKKKYKKYFNFKKDANDYVISYQQKEKEIQKELDACGYFAIVTSYETRTDEALETYRKRDVIEKSFRTIKSYLGMDKLRVKHDDSIEGKIFVIFLASIIRQMMQEKAKSYLRESKGLTVNTLLHELDTIEISKDKEGIYRRRYALTAKQKKILGLFNVDEKMLNEKILQINKKH